MPRPRTAALSQKAAEGATEGMRQERAFLVWSQLRPDQIALHSKSARSLDPAPGRVRSKREYGLQRGDTGGPFSGMTIRLINPMDSDLRYQLAGPSGTRRETWTASRNAATCSASAPPAPCSPWARCSTPKRPPRRPRPGACCARRSIAASSSSAPAAPTHPGTSKTTRAILPAWTSPWRASWRKACSTTKRRSTTCGRIPQPGFRMSLPERWTSSSNS